ncbi:acyl-CoA dehydrogenase family protein [Actinoplanes regularis]|uniref:Acyl-[acyl-carrier-protein] dehydrogenase MbtN n=1 Tax=Actinoplanes regularis TaxID=52697 RepID=A0A239HBD3_9ACTN|nr:acyl-CoA dehydrogenase family protein [Actinoplanes regularis]GIE90971.1 hypothetical protein Are01nite_74510 [Actinoplanes regularis]SNS78475.1 Acyl-CoA dehydrogenase [Actinoplanes regularis]
MSDRAPGAGTVTAVAPAAGAGSYPVEDVATRTGAAIHAAGTPSDARAVWRALGGHGLLDGAGPERLPALLGVLDEHCPVGVVLSVCVQVASALPLLREHAEAVDGGPVSAVHRAAARGAATLALAATDRAGSGSDLMNLGTTAQLNGDEVILDGGKRWITNATTADHALVLARHRPQPHFTSFVWVLAPIEAPGVRVTATEDDLLPGAGLGDIEFDGVRLDRSHLIGRAGRGMVNFARHITTERYAGGVWAAAICRRVLADTQRRLAARPLGAGHAWDNAAIRERFARCLVESWRIGAACAAYRDSPDPMVASMLLKTAVAESLDLVLGECGRLLGADAYGDAGLARLRAATAMFATAGGATGAMLAGIADHAGDLLGRRPW